MRRITSVFVVLQARPVHRYIYTIYLNLCIIKAMKAKIICICLFLLSGLGVYAGLAVRNDVLICNPYTMENDFADSIEHEGYEGGIKFLNACISKYPDSPQFYNNRGNIYKIMHRYEDALDDYNKAISLDDSYMSPRHGKITLAIVQGNYDGQLENINNLIKEYPDSYLLYNTRAVIKLHGNDYKGTIADLTKCISLNKNYKEGYKIRGYAYSGVKEYKNCVKDLSTYLQYKANDADVYYQRALCYSQLPGKSYQMLNDLVLAAELYKLYGNNYQYYKIKDMLNSIGINNIENTSTIQK